LNLLCNDRKTELFTILFLKFCDQQVMWKETCALYVRDFIDSQKSFDENEQYIRHFVKAPQVLHISEMLNYNSSVQFINPSEGIKVTKIGNRTKGMEAAEYFITDFSWKGQIPSGIAQVSFPNNSVLVIGSVLILSDSYVSSRFALANKSQFTLRNYK
jgi:hypothetical protein